MKAKPVSSSLNKKTNALPTSTKFVKPKTFKNKQTKLSTRTPVLDKKLELIKDTLKLKKGSSVTKNRNNLNVKENVINPTKPNINNKCPRPTRGSEKGVEVSIINQKKNGKRRKNRKSRSRNDSKRLMPDNKSVSKLETNFDSSENGKLTKVAENTQKVSLKKKKKKTVVSNQSSLQLNKVSLTVKSLFKLLKEQVKNQTDLFDSAEPIFMQVECMKIPSCTTKQLRFKLPHPIVNELSDILLITADKKGSKNQPDRAVEHYTDLLEKHNIKFIQKVIPLRMLRQEFSQYELKRKLVDQFDMILADANILPSLPKLLGKFSLFSKKMPIAVHLDRVNLKEHLQVAISKTQMTIEAKGNVTVVQVGHTKMDADKIGENICEVSKRLCELYPGGWPNIRSLYLKTATSPSFAVYLSLVSPNTVKPYVQQGKKQELVEGELSTYPDMNVVVRRDGSVFLKKSDIQSTEQVETEFDDEILELAKKYLQSTKTVRYEDSDDEADTVTAAVEDDFLKNYEAAKQANAVDSDKEEQEEEEEEDEDEEEESSDEEEPPIPKKRKMEPLKKQTPGKSPNKKQKMNPQQQNKAKAKKAEPVIGKPQKRGARGGKKNKMSKDQRKALIKRKKAGKK